MKYRKQSDKNIIKNNDNNLRKEKLSPFTNRRNQMSQLEKKSKNICKTIETKEKLQTKMRFMWKTLFNGLVYY